ncbi:MAG: hypothetical protein IKI59_03665 [Clostridia bacterium]|nr:hypothetical protein [Clostridia bacterium]MBR6038859.1 hypothetical protein [Clostridia bacterium]
MVSTKYTSDYRLENVVDPRTGKLVTKAVYRGDWFCFEKPAALVRQRKILFTILVGLLAAAFIGALLLTGINERNQDVIAIEQYYVIIPFVGLMFPIFFMGTAAVRMWRATDKVTREHRDKIGDRFAATGISAAILSGVSAIGHIVSWAINGETVTDMIFLGITLMILAASFAIFFLRRDLSMVQCGTARIAYPDEDPEITRIARGDESHRRDIKKIRRYKNEKN